MASTSKQERYEQICREVLETAPGFILLTGMDGSWVDYLARHYGYTSRKLSCHFASKAKLVDFILRKHLDLAFEVVCLPTDWEGPPVDVLRAMSLALIGYGADHLERHRVFLSHYERRPDAPRRALAQQLVHLTNNFQMALKVIKPRTPTRELCEAAGILLGQLLHAPLWWPRSENGEPPRTTLDAWVCTQIGLLAGIKRPDHRKEMCARLIAKDDLKLV